MVQVAKDKVVNFRFDSPTVTEFQNAKHKLLVLWLSIFSFFFSFFSQRDGSMKTAQTFTNVAMDYNRCYSRSNSFFLSFFLFFFLFFNNWLSHIFVAAPHLPNHGFLFFLCSFLRYLLPNCWCLSFTGVL